MEEAIARLAARRAEYVEARKTVAIADLAYVIIDAKIAAMDEAIELLQESQLTQGSSEIGECQEGKDDDPVIKRLEREKGYWLEVQDRCVQELKRADVNRCSHAPRGASLV